MFELENTCDDFAEYNEKKVFDGRLPDDATTVAAGVAYCVARMFPDATPADLAELERQMCVCCAGAANRNRAADGCR